MKIIDGKKLAQRHERLLKNKLKKLGIPTIVSFCNIEDPASQKYTFLKLSKARQIGIDFIAEEFSTDTAQSYLMEMVQKYGSDPNIDGIMVQLPLPSELNIFKKDLLNLIPPEKDVDGLTSRGNFLSATARAVLAILDEEVSGWKNQIVAVVGSRGEVGKALCTFLEKEKINFFKIDKYEGNLSRDLKKADIIISATGQKNLIKPKMIKKGVILIDVGLGDFDKTCYERAAKYTPVQGGVGPMTVICLMENIVRSFKQRSKLLLPLFNR